MNCRHCGALLEHTFINLGFAPCSNCYVTERGLSRPEKYYPLHVKVCDQCWLVQTEDYTQADELFNSSYAYFSSTSSSWLAHAKEYVRTIRKQLSLDANSLVIEVASNDGYLLKNFISEGVPCLGIEPTESTAKVAEKLNIPILREFFSESLGKELASKEMKADLVIGNNVYAHVPDINDFTAGLKEVLQTNGTITLEFPHLLKMIEERQFDTAYHEHFSYLSLYAVRKIFQSKGLRIYDVEELHTHGGSLRVYGCHEGDSRQETDLVRSLLRKEKERGLQSICTYKNFQEYVNKIKNDFILFLIQQKESGKKVAAYGAAAKGNTLLNYSGVKPDLLPFVCDAADAKIGKYMPGSHIPILEPGAIQREKPDYIVILPWNIKEEVMTQLDFARGWGAKFVTAIPSLEIL